MSAQQPDKIDELLRDWYDRQAMSGHRVHAIRRSVNAVPMRQTRFVIAGTISALVAMLAITTFVINRQGGDAASRALAANVVRVHGMAGPAGPTDLATLTGLGFTPIVPERCKREGYKIVGARYSTLSDGRAVEIRVIDDDGHPQTLLEMRGGGRVTDAKLQVNGVPVSVWHEAGLVMAMTGGD